MSQTSDRVRTPWVTTLVVLILLDGLGWGLGILPGLRYALTHQSLRIVRLLGVGPEIRGLSGPFEWHRKRLQGIPAHHHSRVRCHGCFPDRARLYHASGCVADSGGRLTPGGRTLDPLMPFAQFSRMTDDELKAIWLFLQSLPAKEQVSR